MHSSRDDFADWIAQAQEEKGTLSQISQEKCDELYALAYVLYQNKRYLDASHYFRLLVNTEPSDSKFWKGLGASLQMQKDYEEALNCYCCCVQLSSQHATDPYLYVQTADCYFALKQVDEAFKALEAARSIAKKLDDQRILQHVALMKQVWNVS